MKFTTFKPGEVINVRILKETIDGIEPFKLHYIKSLSTKNNSCYFCEEERINSRFEILDIRKR